MTDKATLSKYLRKVTGDLRDARLRIGELEQRSFEPIAIVGMSCRYPGGVDSPQSLWRLLEAGGDGISRFPENRGWPLERLFDPDPDRPATSYVEESGFLQEAPEFDAEFFGISPREALTMDPQQRLLLEAAWEAIEDAGIDPTALAGSATGVFAGWMANAYVSRVDSELEAYRGTGSSASVVSGRVAYALGLEGPAVTIDTACSSSLVAIHLAAQALRSGECELALAGGVTVMSEPSRFAEFSRQRVLAKDGRCKPFAAAADGIGWSEGVGLVLLERLSEAQRNGHPVLALVRGSATNQDGASNGLTAPNGPSQERVIRQALAGAGLSPAEVDAVEAHGTGTSLGDPIEAQALLATYGRARPDGDPLLLGSIKSNLAHTQAAAGVAGVIKMVMALRAGLLPATIHLDEPTPHVDWSGGTIELLREAQPWQAHDRPRRAGVSSFGVSGTNAHLIIEEAPAAEPDQEEEVTEGSPADPEVARALEATPLLLAGKSEAALRGQAGRLAAHLRAEPELDPVDVGFSLASGRAAFERRAAAVAAEPTELLEALDALAGGAPHSALAQGAGGGGKLAFVFPGHGSDWEGMALELLGSSPLFAERIAACEEALDPFLEFSLGDVLRGAEGSPSLERIDVLQPALFAVMIGLAGLWHAHGVRPAALVGHSQGEAAAAHLAGALSLEDAARIVARRSQAIESLKGLGEMMAIGLPAAETERRIEPWQGRISLAVANSPASSAVSGEREALLELAAACEADGIRARQISDDRATHWDRVERVRERLLDDLAPIRPRAAELPIYSSMSSGPVAGEELDAEYWYRSFRQPVRFEAAVQALVADGYGKFVEVSAHPVLTTAIEQTAEASDGGPAVAAVGSLRRGEGGLDRFAKALAEAHCHGVAVDWEGFFGGRGKRVPLPTYAFQRKRYWLEESSAAAEGVAAHPLLATAMPLPGADGEEQGWLFNGRLSLGAQPWLGDHAVHGVPILPGTGFVEMALRAGEQAGAPEIAELTIEAPLVLPEQGGVEVQVKVGAADGDGRRSVAVHSRPEGQDDELPWAANAAGVLAPAADDPLTGLGEWPPVGVEPLEVESLYERTAELGVDYGPAFQNVRAAWSRGEEVFAEVELGEEQAAEARRFGLHPALLDAALHPAVAADRPEQGEGPRAPFAWRGVRLAQAGAARLRVALLPAGKDALSLRIDDDAGLPVAAVESLAARPLGAAQLATAVRRDDSLFRLDWIERELPVAGGEEVRVERLAADPKLDPAAAALQLCRQVLATLREAIADEEGERVAFVSQGAVAVAAGPVDPALAAALGLVRSAQAEHPGRFLLIDSDGGEASETALASALAQEQEPQLALREGRALAPRLARAGAPAGEAPAALDPQRTVLITGGTGAIGSDFARHLAAEHGVRRLLLTSRRGPQAPRAQELVRELEELGAQAEVVACDVADRSQLQALLASIPPEHPLGAVYHAAAIFDNALIEALDDEQLQRVFEAKAKSAWDLHELTAGADLAEFVLFSSGAGTFHHPGQGNYAAANAFLDALAHQRRAAGLAATSIAWGLWEREGVAPEERLRDVDLERVGRSGFAAMSPARGLELFERARADGSPFLVAADLDTAALRALARSGDLAPIHSGIVRVPSRRAADAGALARRLAEAPEAEREGIAVALVAEHVAAVLGHDSGADIDPNAAFKDLGFDSLGAVELRNRLGQASGLRLPSTLVFDHPTTLAAAAFVRVQAEGSRPAAPAARPATARSEEPVAIVGIGCRFPGGVESAADLWELVAAGRDAVAPFPDDRGWDLDGLYDPDPDRLGTTYAREGGFLDDAPGFDAEFFGISPREALAMDPQQRLLLEAAWEACEDAGLDPGSLVGTPTGVFTGVMHHDYGLSGGRPGPTGEGATSAGSFVSGRIAYSLGLEGPAITVDTACSSSLVAMHLAAQALRSGECDLALAGGVAVSATPGMLVMFSHQRGLAPDGRCKAFAAAADGTGVSEGVGLLVLERLSEARRNGHEVLAVLRGSATNQDGASNGITAPNGPSQERVIRQALANAGLAPAEVDAVEAHGTGTSLGDPIEAQALLATYGQEREQPLWLGSIKSNFGHAQAAAGVAAVIKMAMAMRHGVLPQTLHVDEPTAHVDWSAGAVELLAEARPWEANGHPRRAGVSSFGLSGTNAHVILEEAPAEETADREAAAEQGPAAGSGAIGAAGIPLLLPLSAKGEPALRAQAERLAAHLRRHEDIDPADAGFTLATARAVLDRRAAAVAADREELLDALDALAAGNPHAGLLQGRAAGGKLAFLFSGQGAQRPGAGKKLYERLPLFASALDELCAELDQHLERPLKDLLFADEGSEEAALLDRTEFTQPALFALEVALFRQLEEWGMRPDLLLGHSIGELAAAHVAGVFDLAGACKLVAARGALMGALPEGGAMAAIEASEQEVAAELPEGLSIAGVNSPTSVVVSGEESAVLDFAEQWKGRDRRATRLRVSHAFHSELMEPMLEDFAEVAKSIELSPPKLTVISNLTGEPLAAEQATDPGYWVAQVRNAVRFADGAAYLAAQGVGTCIELGPSPALCPMAQASFAATEREAATAPALREGRDEAESLLAAIASAHCNGASPDWRSLFGSRKRVSLPTYAFQRRRYWLQPQAGEGDAAGAGLDSAEHPLLGAVTSIPGPVEGQEAWLLSGRLSLHSHPWLADHEVFGVPLLPGTAFVEMALKAGELAGAAAIEELTLEAPLVLPERGAVQVQVSVGAADEDGARPLSIRSRPEGGDQPQWLTHAEGSLGPATGAGADLREWPPAGAEPLAVDSLYESLAALGIEYGPAFQGVRAAWSRGEELFVESELGEEQAADAAGFGLHPALLDTVFHPALIAAGAEGGPKAPFAWRGVRLHAAGASRVRMALLPQGEESAALEIADANGEPLASVASLVARELSSEALAEFRTGSEADALFTLEWDELPSANGVAADADVRMVELTPDPALDPPAAAQALAAQALATVQEAVAGEDGARLAFRTRGAVATAAGEPADPAAAAAWGLIRSAQAEHPGRFLLVDADAGAASAAALGAALAQESESQLALRGGTVLAPRLERAPAPAGEPEPLDPEKTVLVTGATGTLGSLLARHLVAAHGARHLLLLSRRGPAAAADGLTAELEALGAAVRVVACDVADRPQLEALLASVPAEHPLGAVFHVAGVLDDGIVESLDPERLQTVMAPKANGAWHLHELTREARLSHFVLFSSAAASFGSPGQANYAAANAFLDALAARRQAEGLPARTIAWGPWGAESAMSSGLSGADRARLERSGLRPLAAAEGLELLDRAAALPGPFAVAAALDRAGLRALARAGALPPLFAGLVRVPARRSAAGADDGALARRLAETPEAEREEVAVAVVAEHVAAVLGHASAAAVDRSMPFKELGFDSLGAVELRNRLGAATGLRLPSTLVFDYPTAAAVGAHLCSLVDPAAVAGDEVEQTIERLRTLLDRLQGEQREQADGRLRGLLSEGYAGDADAGAVERIRAASAEEILAIVNEEIGEK